MSNGRGPSVALQIAVIILVMLTLGLAIATMHFWHTRGEFEAVKDSANAAADADDAAARLAGEQCGDIVGMISGTKDSSPDGIKKTIDQYVLDMQKWNNTFSYFDGPQDALPPETGQGAFRNYRNSVYLLLSTLASANSEVADEDQKIALLDARIKELERVRNAEIADVGVKYGEEEAENKDTEEKHFATRTKQLGDNQVEIKQKVDARNTDVATEETDHQKKYGDLQKEEVKTLLAIRQTKESLNELTRDTFEKPDGEIVWVITAEHSVWINLGRADKLVPYVLFSVYGPDGTDVGRGKRKGAIEVTKILGERLAAARIVEDDIRNPLLPGDKIYTPAWHPGRQEHLAMCGLLDIDGNGIEDRETMEKIVRLAGAVLDLKQRIDGKGTTEGAVTPQTRYLVTGEPPSAEKDRDAYVKIIGDARKAGVREIPLKDFLDQVGFAGLTDFKEFGVESNPRDFDDVQRASELSGQSLNRFRERKAPKRAGSSAYGSGTQK
ncbi:MAG: hypothetical protein HYS13_01775 [Planctomycetia bacterium]|nr:hypothetical protein [Planctomycetia bacterium]